MSDHEILGTLDSTEAAATMIDNADTAMYRAKEQGRDAFQRFLPSMQMAVQQPRQQSSKRLKSSRPSPGPEQLVQCRKRPSDR